jgi:hypothetical protein
MTRNPNARAPRPLPIAMGGVLTLATLATLAPFGCGTSSHVNTDAGIDAAPPDAGGPPTLGAVCADASTCASHFCLPLAANLQGAGGVCSAVCQSSAGCGAQSLCLVEPSVDGGEAVTDAGVCYRTCAAASDCADGLPCIWHEPIDSGICQPLSAGFCQDIAATGSCEACLGQHCCAAVTACAEDIACAQGELDASSVSLNPQTQAVAACASAEADGGPCGAECKIGP